MTDSATGQQAAGAHPGQPTTQPLVVTLPDQEWCTDVVALLEPAVAQSITVHAWDLREPAEQVLGAAADQVSTVVLPYWAPLPAAASLAQMPTLNLVQALTAGYEHLLEPERVIPAGVRLANAAGVHDASTAELAVGLILASLRGIDDAARDTAAGRWRHTRRASLADRKILVLGVGGVGGAVIARLRPFEVEITRVGRTARHDDDGPVHALDELAELLPQHDVVVLALPASQDTQQLVGEEFLAAMPDGALLVNVGRGPLVDTDALRWHLESGRLRAALDVTDPEPLPDGHPLWSAPGLLVTPHLGGDTTAFRPRALKLVAAQLTRLAGGEPPANVVA